MGLGVGNFGAVVGLGNGRDATFGPEGLDDFWGPGRAGAGDGSRGAETVGRLVAVGVVLRTVETVGRVAAADAGGRRGGVTTGRAGLEEAFGLPELLPACDVGWRTERRVSCCEKTAAVVIKRDRIATTETCVLMTGSGSNEGLLAAAPAVRVELPGEPQGRLEPIAIGFSSCRAKPGPNPTALAQKKRDKTCQEIPSGTSGCGTALP